MNKQKIMKARKTDLIDYGIAWGFPGVAICIISVLASLKVGGDFPHSMLAEAMTFLSSFVLLWLLYTILFQQLPSDIAGAIARTVKTESPTEGQESEDGRDDGAPVMPDGIRTDQPHTQEETFERHRLAFRRKEELRRQEMLASVRHYVLECISPFAEMDTVRRIQEDVMAWADNPGHVPAAAAVSRQLTTLDLRHFVWNIAARLRMSGHTYTTLAQGFFIKRMFPDTCKYAEADYLGKNLRLRPDEGIITIDKPLRDSPLFHAKMNFE